MAGGHLWTDENSVAGRTPKPVGCRSRSLWLVLALRFGFFGHRSEEALREEPRNVSRRGQPTLDEHEQHGQQDESAADSPVTAGEQRHAGQRWRNRQHEDARQFDRLDNACHRLPIRGVSAKARRLGGHLRNVFTRSLAGSSMFTGIVEEPGEIVARDRTEDGLRLRIGAETVATGLEHGQSISVSGVCLTVERFAEGEWFELFLASETIDRTYLGDLDVGSAVNLERAMPADGRFDGHVVQGHVDAVATVSRIESVDEDWYFEFELPEGYDRYVVEKGSITLDGISLTVADLDEAHGRVTVAIIPTTYELTTLSTKDVGDPVHLEVDVLAKYVERLLEARFE